MNIIKYGLLMIMVLIAAAAILAVPLQAEADVAILDVFPATPQISGGTTATISYTALAGTDRYLVVLAGCVDTATVARSMTTATWGAATINQIANSDVPTGNRRMAWVGGAAIGSSGTSQTNNLTLTISSCAGGFHAWVGTFSGVDQTTPTGPTFTRYDNNLDNVADFGTGLAVPAGGAAVFSLGANQTVSTLTDTLMTYTWNQVAAGGGTGVEGWGASASGGTTNPTITMAANYRGAIAAAVLNKTACTDSDPTTTVTINPPTSGTTVGGTYTVKAAVAGEGDPSNVPGHSATITIAGSTACNASGAAMAWNSGTSTWDYAWDTSACGTGAPETGVTIDVTFTDADCNTTHNATQVSSITINNVCTDSSPSTITVISGQTYSGDNFDVSGGFSSTGNVGAFEYQVETSTGTLCRAWSATAAIPATTASGSLCGNFTNGGTYRLYVRGTDPDCGGQTINASPTFQNFTWNSCSDSDVSTITINPPISGSTVKGVYTITATVTGETIAPNDYTSMSVTTAGTTSGLCDVAGAAMTDQGGGVWTYAWDTSICGNPVETGITIDASGTDPDCSTSRSAAQVINITMDNTCDSTIDLTCTECHNTPPIDGPRVRATGATPGSHQLHSTAGLPCTKCHIENGADQNHRNAYINMNSTSVSYSEGSSFLQVSSPTLGNCANTTCHGTFSSTWGTNTTNDGCTKCHGTGTASPAADMYKAPPSDLAGNTLNTDAEVGAHRAHLNSPTATTHRVSATIVCTECHKVPAQPSDAGHYDTGNPAELNFGTLANKAGALAPSYVEATGVCNNTYCHGKTLSDGDKPRAWNSPGLNGTKANDCAYCHGFPPLSITDHGGLNVNNPGECAGCHDHVSTNNDGFIDYAKHINGNIEGGSCVGCHATERGSPTLYRRDVTGTAGDIEPGLVSHHIKNTTAIDGASCQVCHDQITHKGVADPGVKIFNADTAASISYTGTASELVPHCLSCHDSAGAVNNTTTPFSASGDLNKPFDVLGGHGANASGVTQSCVQTSCHGNFGAAGTTLDPKANAHGSTVADIRDSAATKVYDGRAPAAADAGTFICLDCHTTYYNGGAWTGTAFTDHNTHVASYSVPCKACHYNTPHGAAYINFDTADVTSGRRTAKLTPPAGRGGMLLTEGAYTPAPYGATNAEVPGWDGGGMGSQSMRLYVRSWPAGAWATTNCGYTNAFPPTGVTAH